jgi:hypothetical protein
VAVRGVEAGGWGGGSAPRVPGVEGGTCGGRGEKGAHRPSQCRPGGRPGPSH